MASGADEIVRAYRRVAVLRLIVLAERDRASAAPLDARNVRLGLVEPDLPLKEARRQIEDTFAEILLMLDHLHITHTAAQFELEAKKRLDAVIAATRDAVKKSREGLPHWPADLVRTLSSFEGLRDIERVLGLPFPAAGELKRVRTARNKFSHGVELGDVPDVTPQIALALLLDAFDRLK